MGLACGNTRTGGATIGGGSTHEPAASGGPGKGDESADDAATKGGIGLLDQGFSRSTTPLAV